MFDHKPSVISSKVFKPLSLPLPLPSLKAPLLSYSYTMSMNTLIAVDSAVRTIHEMAWQRIVSEAVAAVGTYIYGEERFIIVRR